MALEIISLPDVGPQNPRVEFVVGHLPFSEVGAAFSEKYANPEFASSLYRYEYILSADVENPEQFVLNARPTAPGAIPVTILYFGNSTVPQI